jgi:threonine dehydrogenase-like Zn-dependent dehydrogenase
MLAVQITGPSQLTLVETARPELRGDGDAILMVTTSAIGPWDVSAYERGAKGVAPGAQFVGIVVQTGSSVKSVGIDDLVVCRVAPRPGDGPNWPLCGGHAEYVWVPDADSRLIRTTAAAEERTVLAGGAVALGIAAAEEALTLTDNGPILAWGCDASALAALAWLNRKAAPRRTRFAYDHVTARSTVAKTYGAEMVSLHEIAELNPKVALFGFPPRGPAPRDLAAHLPDGATVISLDPAQDLHGAFTAGINVITCDWPMLEQVKRATLAVQLREINLTPLVSHVKPLDEAEDAYRQAAEAPPGSQTLLLKP